MSKDKVKYKIDDVVQWKNSLYNVSGISPIIGITNHNGGCIDTHDNFFVKAKPGQTGSEYKDYTSFGKAKQFCHSYNNLINDNQKVYLVDRLCMKKIKQSSVYLWTAFWLSLYDLHHNNNENLQYKIYLINSINFTECLEFINEITSKTLYIGTSSAPDGSHSCWEYMVNNSCNRHGRYLIDGLNLPHEFDLSIIAQHSAVKVIFKDEIDF